jgi:hypothetical protein
VREVVVEDTDECSLPGIDEGELSPAPPRAMHLQALLAL